MAKKLILLLNLFFIPISAYALACPNILTSVKVEYFPTPPKVGYVENSALRNKVGTFSSQDTLGSFNSDQTLEFNSTVSYLKTGNEICAKIANANLLIKMNSFISITKEAASSSCVNNRVITHEQEHYERTSKAMYMTKQYAEQVLGNLVKQDFVGSSSDEVNQKIKQYENRAIQDINSFMGDSSAKNNAPLDTSENYALESKICSSFDENLVHSRIKSFK